MLDGVDVINYSISGGSDPFIDPVELAFLDAYAAGVFVSASAGNAGPERVRPSNHLATVGHHGRRRRPRRTTFTSQLTLTDGEATTTLTGTSITEGIDAPLPVVLASDPPYGHALCDLPAEPGTFTGKIVAVRTQPRRPRSSRDST